MYKNKNKALSFVEFIIIIVITLFINFFVFTTFYSLNKGYIFLLKDYKREREIDEFKDLVKSHLSKDMKEIRVISLKEYKRIKSVDDIFKNTNITNTGNLLIIKFSSYDKSNNRENTFYRFFFFNDTSAKISYSEDYKSYEVYKISRGTTIINNCNGSFYYNGKILKMLIKDLIKGKNYETIEYCP